MKAREIMTPNPEFVTLEDTVSRAAGIMREADVGLVPVVENGSTRRLRGVITDRDIAVQHVADKHSDDCPVTAHMSESLAKVGPEDDTTDVMRRMRENRVRRVPVVEDGDRLVGIVAQADLALKLGREAAEQVEKTLEEISKPSR